MMRLNLIIVLILASYACAMPRMQKYRNLQYLLRELDNCNDVFEVKEDNCTRAFLSSNVLKYLCPAEFIELLEEECVEQGYLEE